MKIALVHDYLTQVAGGDRVLQAWVEIWPQAEIYTSVYDAKVGKWLGFEEDKIHTNFAGKLPWARSLRRYYTPFYPSAFKSQRIEADVIISSSSFSAKFAHKKEALNIAYIHTPPKFLYSLKESSVARTSLRKLGKTIYKTLGLPVKMWLRFLDKNSLNEIDYLLVNSHYIKEQVARIYKKDSIVFYPPVDTKKFFPKAEKQGDYFLIVSRLEDYKKIDVAVRAFNKTGQSLKIIGTGQQEKYLKSIAHENIEFLGLASDEEVVKKMQACKALVFPTKEDLGIVPLEAQAAGKPVIAYRAAGALETVVEGKTGVFFDQQSEQAIIKVLENFDEKKFSPAVCREQAEKFSKEEFKRKFRFFVEEAYFQWKNKKA